MIRFTAVEVSPQTVASGGAYIIRVKAEAVPERFKFPLVIPKLLGIIFKKGSKR